MIPVDIQNTIKSISIRGRTAMAITCLENVINERQMMSPKLAELLDIFWQFVEADDLGEWDERIYRWRNLEGDLSENSKFTHLPEFILEMISETETVAGGNLYCGVVGYSSLTFNPLVNVLNLALENGFEIPDVEPFKKSRFSKDGGWGFAVTRNFFKS
jgi:hypothetical protein